MTNPAENIEQSADGFEELLAIEQEYGTAANDDQIEETIEHQARIDAGAAYAYDPNLAAILHMLTAQGFQVVATRRGAHWALQDEEGKKLSVATAQLIHHLMPKTKTGPVGNFIMVVGAVAGPRLVLDIMLKQQAEPVATQTKGGTDGANK